MADSNITKRALAMAMKELMEQTPFSKISVGDICEKCGMNRKSFYYHFRDKYDLVNWIFDVEFLQLTVQHEEGIRWTLLGELCRYFYDNRVFYRRALEVKGQNSFSDHFREMLYPLLRELLKKVLAEPKQVEFYINFYSDAFICSLERWLSSRDCMPPEQFVELLQSCVLTLADLTKLEEDEELGKLTEGTQTAPGSHANL
ncbi:MAG: TetR/AcrR family transcriptional regulator C-terminal domain-containing protein [Clostridiales bacterium]|nr:TetR/AcrR family transcriptional regulator C-terminal domain-containing protein [Clostridiales bacterium]